MIVKKMKKKRFKTRKKTLVEIKRWHNRAPRRVAVKRENRIVLLE